MIETGGEGVLAKPFPYQAILNIRFGTLEDFDVRFFKVQERYVDFPSP